MSLDYELSPNLWVRLKSFLRYFPRNLRSWQDFYATAGRSGRAKYQLWGLALFLVPPGASLLRVSREKEKVEPMLREKLKALPWLVNAWHRARHCDAKEESASPRAVILAYFWINQNKEHIECAVAVAYPKIPESWVPGADPDRRRRVISLITDHPIMPTTDYSRFYVAPVDDRSIWLLTKPYHWFRHKG